MPNKWCNLGYVLIILEFISFSKGEKLLWNLDIVKPCSCQSHLQSCILSISNILNKNWECCDDSICAGQWFGGQISKACKLVYWWVKCCHRIHLLVSISSLLTNWRSLSFLAYLIMFNLLDCSRYDLLLNTEHLLLR